MLTFTRVQRLEQDLLSSDVVSGAVTSPAESGAHPGLVEATGHGNQAILTALSSPDIAPASPHGHGLPAGFGHEPHVPAPTAQQPIHAPVELARGSLSQGGSSEARSSTAGSRSAPRLISAAPLAPSLTSTPPLPAHSPPSISAAPVQPIGPSPEHAQESPALCAARRRFEEQLCASIDEILAGADSTAQALNQDGATFEAALARDTADLEQSVTFALSEAQALIENHSAASHARIDGALSDESDALSMSLTGAQTRLVEEASVAQESISAGAFGAQERISETGTSTAAKLQEGADTQRGALRVHQPEGADAGLRDAQREADRRIAAAPEGQLCLADEQARTDLNDGASMSVSLLSELGQHATALVQEGVQGAQGALSESGEKALGGLGALQAESHALLLDGTAKAQEALQDAHTATLQRARDAEQATLSVERERRAGLVVEIETRAAEGANALSAAAQEASGGVQASQGPDEGVAALEQGATRAEERASAFVFAMGQDAQRHQDWRDTLAQDTHDRRHAETNADVLTARADAERQGAGLDQLADEAIQRGEQGGAEARAAVTEQASATTSDVDAVVSMAHGRVGEAEERASELLGAGADEAIQAREDALVTPTRDAQSDARETIRADHERSGLERAMDFASGLLSGAWDAVTAIASAVSGVVVPTFMIVAGALSQLLSNALFGLLNPVLDLVPNEAFHQGRDIGEDLTLIVGVIEAVAGLAVILAGITVTTGGGGLVAAGSGGVLAAPAGGLVVAVDGALITIGGVLIADSLIMLSMSGKGSRHQDRFREMIEAEDRGSGSKRGKQRDGTPGNNGAQNKQVDALAQKYKLTASERRRLHDDITGQDCSYAEIEGIVREIVSSRRP